MTGQEAKRPTILEGDRFDAVSTVLGQLAHDFNNLLTPLLAYPQLIRADLPEGCYSINLIEVVEKTSRDMAHITRQLLDLTTRRKFEMRSVDINAVTDRAVVDVKHEMPGTNVVINMNLDRSLPMVQGAAERMAHAIFHVCRNAVEAMEPNGGTVEVRTERSQEVARDSGSGQPLYSGEYIKVTIQDAGVGIPDEVRTRIFEPFITTKKAGGRRSAGLGLSVAYRILLDHDGGIDVFSSVGQGTTVSLLFPLRVNKGQGTTASQEPLPATDTMASLPVSSASMSPLRAHEPTATSSILLPCDKGRILIVDDEKTILRLFQMILSSSLPDRKIDLAANGAEAVELFKKNRHALLLMDLHMPVMNGKVAFEEVERFCAENKWEMPSVVFCTGFAPPDTICGLVSANPLHHLLSKPVSSDVLVDTVKSRLM